MGIWAKARQIRAGMGAAYGAGRRDQRDDLEPVPADGVAAEQEQNTDPMQGYSGIYASELIDDKTCPKCAANDGREYTSMAQASADYPDDHEGGYSHCESESGCRGTLILKFND